MFGRSMLARMNVDWAAGGYDTDELDGLVEFGLWVLHSLVLDPRAKRSRAELRSFLQRWAAPAVRAKLLHGRRLLEEMRKACEAAQGYARG